MSPKRFWKRHAYVCFQEKIINLRNDLFFKKNNKETHLKNKMSEKSNSELFDFINRIFLEKNPTSEQLKEIQTLFFKNKISKPWMLLFKDVKLEIIRKIS